MLSDHCSPGFDKIVDPWHPWGAGLLRPDPKPRFVGKVAHFKVFGIRLSPFVRISKAKGYVLNWSKAAGDPPTLAERWVFTSGAEWAGGHGEVGSGPRAVSRALSWQCVQYAQQCSCGRCGPGAVPGPLHAPGLWNQVVISKTCPRNRICSQAMPRWESPSRRLDYWPAWLTESQCLGASCGPVWFMSTDMACEGAPTCPTSPTMGTHCHGGCP